MAISATGGLLAGRYGFTRLPFGVAFVLAPSIAFYQKKEADFNVISEFSRYLYSDEGGTPGWLCSIFHS